MELVPIFAPIIEKVLPYLVAGAAALAAFGVALWRARAKGAAAVKARQAAEEAKARDVADQVDNDVGALPAEAVRQELKTWEK
ncbi:ABC transporter permease [Mesorhizobium sp. M3A.F.Ca.ET.174.01.1.1]|uniref:ABC transporter permease n=1 Tax=unclassified Mesorhizobium TaxID=325217 RepID=UPI001093C2BB|nr:MULTISPECIES: ABC transporter permease [unclassified Mesorhizobium]TGS86735.1 ABC transporter permease [Mesorhizobium sp. M3A.F.Ca.ET.175.01.1.1]TGT25183.1 ABC transporter permease [Mesorhizobium sp. M3A.F.Ca.ET.174.01.1.1]